MLLAIAVAALAPVSRAEAASYQVVACDAASDRVSGSWTWETNVAAKIESAVACPSAGMGYSGLQALTFRGVIGPDAGAYGQWRMAAPTGTTITRVRLSRWLGMEAGSGWRPYGRQHDGTLLPGETCVVASGQDDCSVGPSHVDLFVSTASIAYGIECISVNGCVNGSTIYAARAAIYSATVTITDDDAPTVTTPTGALVTESGWHRGVEAASFNGSDETGLRALRLYIDGTLRASATPGAADWSACVETSVVPCGNPGADRTLWFDTTALSDGAHLVQVAAVDGAGNETRSTARSITVDNAPPAAAQDLRTAGGSAWSASPSITASWTNPGGQVAPITTAYWRLCPKDSGTGCVAGQTAASGGGLSGLQLPAEGEWDLAVALEDAAGNRTPADSAATTTVRYDATAPAAPAALAIAPRSEHDPAFAASWQIPGGQTAPLVTAEWTLCRRDAASPCSTSVTAPDAPLSAGLPAEGEYTLSVRLRDAAGHTGPAATTELRYNPAPPAPNPSPVAPERPRVAPELRMSSAVLQRDRRRLIVQGRIARGATGRVRVTVTLHKRTGGERRRSVDAPIRSGRFVAKLRLSAAHARAPRASVVTRYAGSPGFAPATGRRQATIRR